MRIHTKILLITLLLTVSCTHNNSEAVEKHVININNDSFEIKTYSYDAVTIPEFFKAIIDNHRDDFSFIYSDKYKALCKQYNFDANDHSNIEAFYTLLILHELFTSKTAANNSTGKILNIPYMWHWVTPNPRHKIHMVDSGKTLYNINPLKEFSKYNTYADIDRTPYLYLSDLVKNRPQYYNHQSDTFATFGWCSEREMAFVCLMKLLGYKGKIAAPGMHSWSEFIVPMILDNGTSEKYTYIVDNTFDEIRIEKTDCTVIEWENNIGDGRLPKWYNKKASSEKELKRINNHVVPPKAAMRIESKIVKYLNQNQHH